MTDPNFGMFAPAAHGDLDHLRMLRDSIAQCADDGLPWEEALTQSEVCARLAAAHGEPTDVLALASLLLLRSVHLRSMAENALNSAGVFLDADMPDAYADALKRGEYATHRAELFENEANELFPSVAHGNDPQAAAFLMSAISLRADNGDDGALVTLQRLVDEMPKENLAALKAALRNLEQGIDA